jgi:2C-methyl-D-erythritol 2,4-cyclodiphosphate synthase
MDLASTITMTATLTSSINIKSVFEILPIVHPRNPDGTKFMHPKNTREKIPYFGVENIIVCVKYINKIRGIRQNKKHMNNVISVDLQVYNKNINLKLAKNNLQLTGATSDVMGRNSF